MANDTDTVVFVGAADLADLTGKTRARIYQLFDEIGTPNSVLPEGHALINGYPIFQLDIIRPLLEEAGYSIAQAKAASLRQTRSVERGLVPVGVDEAAEALGIGGDQLRGRVKSGTALGHRFKMGPKRVWDLSLLVADAMARGYEIDEAAYDRWRLRNGGGRPLSVNAVSASLHFDATVVSVDASAAIRVVQRLLDNPEILNAALAKSGVRVLTSSAQVYETGIA